MYRTRNVMLSGHIMQPSLSECLVLCTFLLSIQLSTMTVSAQKQDLNIMLIVSFGQSGFNSSGVVPAADIALEDINRTPDLLPGYTLKYDRVRDSQCHRSRSLDAFFNGILNNPVKLAVIGCGCSPATEPVAEISHRWNIPQISYASTLAALSDRTRFRRHFRNNLPIAAPALRSTLEHFNWKRITFLTQDESLFTVAESTFRAELEPVGITVESRTFATTEDPIPRIENVVDNEHRVFFLNSFSGIARKVICYAYSQNFTYPNYVWMGYDWFPPKWWTLERSQVVVNCSDTELTNFMDKALSFQWRPFPDDANATTDTGKSLVEFEAEYERRGRAEGYNTITHGIRLYDGMWALAFALNKTMTMVESAEISGTGCEDTYGSLVPLHMFNYSNEMMGCLIQWNLQRTNFSGVTGNVRFDENGTRIYPNVRLLQYQRKGMEIIRKRFAVLNIADNYTFSFLSGLNDDDIYPNGVPPDGTPKNVTSTYKVALVVIVDISAIVGMIFAIVCLVFTIVFRKRKAVRLSSPNLNYFIIVGALLMYFSIFFYVLPTMDMTTVQARCEVQHFLFSIGYSFAFGAVLVKMWRVYHIFSNPQPNKKILTDVHLIVVVLIITGIVIILLVLEEAFPSLRGHVQLDVDMENPQGIDENGVRQNNKVWVCYETLSPKYFWQIFIFAYLAILQIIGIVLAFQTRRVKLRGLRDSKFIAILIYISSIILVALALETFALRSYINIGSGIIAAGVFMLTTMFLSLIFIPKMILLWKDPEGKTVTTASNAQTPSPSTVNKDMKIASLERNIGEKETVIAKLKEEINLLKRSGLENSTKP